MTERPFSAAGRVLGVIIVAVALLAGAVQLQAARERRYSRQTVDDEALYLRSGVAVRRLASAYTALAADLYWIRAIQHYGATKLRLTALQKLGPEPPPSIAALPSDEYALLYPLLDITTTLDPLFNMAYRFGAVFLAEPFPSGPGRPDLAIALIEKGLRARPDKWEYMQDIGFVHYWYEHDYRAAAERFRKASELPGAPWWLRSLAATTLAQGGDRQSSKLMWESILQTSDFDWLRRDAERRLVQLRALDDIDALQRVVDNYARREGRPPADWGALIRSDANIPGVPLDPSRTPYELGSDGRVRLSASSSLYPLPVEPAGQTAPPPS